MKFGLLGEHLGHSYSPQIHQLLHGEAYGLYEVPPDEVESFLRTTELDGINVTIPYKRAVLPFCISLSDTAKRIGSVNTLIRKADGWHGENTDGEGFRHMLETAGIDPFGRKILILGGGGTSLTARTVLTDLGAADITILVRTLPEEPAKDPRIRFDTYDHLRKYRDASIIVNTTPVGMYPANGQSLLDLAAFPECVGVADVIYNPARTALLLQAEALGIPCVGGLDMLVAQARRSAEMWLGRDIPEERMTDTRRKMARDMRNIILIGMPGCGKTVIGEALRASTGRALVDTDEEVERMTGRKIPDILLKDGEEAFRALETEAIAEAGKRSGCIIATGGGCVTRQENAPLLRQNGIVLWIQRDLSLLSREGRPLSQAMPAEQMYAARKELYARFADAAIPNDASVEAAVRRILALPDLSD